MDNPPSNAEPTIFIDWTLAFKNPLAQAAMAYWEKCRGDRLMPMKRDLSARAMKPFLADVALIDVHARAKGGWDFSVRLAGENPKRVFGNVVGKFFGEFLDAEGEKRWRMGAEAVCIWKAPLRNYGRVTFERKEWLDFETLLAPLGVGTEVRHLFAVFTTRPRPEMG